MIIEMGILAPFLWILCSAALLLSCWRVVRRLRQTRLCPIGVAVLWYAFLLLIPLTFGSLNSYLNYINNVYLWLMVGVLFRLPTLLPSPSPHPVGPSPSVSSPETAADQCFREQTATGAECVSKPKQKHRLAVVSPFLGKSFGTERTVIEWLTHLPDTFEIHVYSQHLEDLDGAHFIWHRIPKMPGPHLFNFLWWFAANHIWRAVDRLRGLEPDLVYSPGINCLDADVISVHIVFAEYLRQLQSQRDLAQKQMHSRPRIFHRKLYYRLIVALERHIYANPQVPLVLYAKKTAKDLERFYDRHDRFPVLYLGLDHDAFNPVRRAELRNMARGQLGITNDRFILLLVGNDRGKRGSSFSSKRYRNCGICQWI